MRRTGKLLGCPGRTGCRLGLARPRRPTRYLCVHQPGGRAIPMDVTGSRGGRKAMVLGSSRTFTDTYGDIPWHRAGIPGLQTSASPAGTVHTVILPGKPQRVSILQLQLQGNRQLLLIHVPLNYVQVHPARRPSYPILPRCYHSGSSAVFPKGGRSHRLKSRALLETSPKSAGAMKFFLSRRHDFLGVFPTNNWLGMTPTGREAARRRLPRIHRPKQIFFFLYMVCPYQTGPALGLLWACWAWLRLEDGPGRTFAGNRGGVWIVGFPAQGSICFFLHPTLHSSHTFTTPLPLLGTFGSRSLFFLAN